MKALWVFTKAFTPEECNSIIETVKQEAPTWAMTGDSDEHNPDKTFNVRRSKVFWIQRNHPKLGYLLDKLWNTVTPINNQYFGAHLLDLPPLQFTQYSEQYQGEYKMHMDLDWMEERLPGSRPNFQRKISCIVQLSDPKDYEGGNFEFGNDVQEKPPAQNIKEQGTLLAFPSFLYHGVRPVTKGTRYSLVGWFEGPHWC